jgi:hypothetical protein
MRRALLIPLVALLAACAPVSQLFQRGPRPDPNVEAQYARALALLEPGATRAAMDTAVVFLDAYLAHAGHVERRPDANALRRLALDAIQLARVAEALQQERAAAADVRTKSGEPAAPGDGDSLREIQRLKEELAAANAELERIRKRLATQKP